jgi:hypothetical protein
MLSLCKTKAKWQSHIDPPPHPTGYPGVIALMGGGVDGHAPNGIGDSSPQQARQK